MSELCERCGWPKMVQHAPDWRERCWWNFPAVGDSQTACLLRAHDRERARADRYQAEFSACKALLIAAEGRAEEARAALEALLPFRVHAAGCAEGATDFCTCGLREVAIRARRALAALPVEPARPEQKEIQREPWAGTPFEAEYRMLCDGIARERARASEARALAIEEAARVCENEACGLDQGPIWVAAAQVCADKVRDLAAVEVLAELARSTSEPAPQNPPPSPTGDTE